MQAIKAEEQGQINLDFCLWGNYTIVSEDTGRSKTKAVIETWAKCCGSTEEKVVTLVKREEMACSCVYMGARIISLKTKSDYILSLQAYPSHSEWTPGLYSGMLGLAWPGSCPPLIAHMNPHAFPLWSHSIPCFPWTHQIPILRPVHCVYPLRPPLGFLPHVIQSLFNCWLCRPKIHFLLQHVTCYPLTLPCLLNNIYHYLKLSVFINWQSPSRL